MRFRFDSGIDGGSAAERASRGRRAPASPARQGLQFFATDVRFTGIWCVQSNANTSRFIAIRTVGVRDGIRRQLKRWPTRIPSPQRHDPPLMCIELACLTQLSVFKWQMTTQRSDLIAAKRLHNRAVAFVSNGHGRAAIPIFSDAFEMGLAASGRALFTLLSANRESREHAARVAARAALMDPMHFKFVNDALHCNAAFAADNAIAYERVRAVNPPPWSIVVCSHNDVAYESFLKNIHRVRNNVLIEVIRVNDARSMNDGYERGLKRAQHEHVILCHHDIDILIPDCFERLSLHLNVHDFVGVAGASRMSGPALLFDGQPHLLGRLTHPDARSEDALSLHTFAPFAHVRRAVALDGVFIAARKSALLQLGFDQSNPTFHYYDVDLTHRASLQGYKIVVAPDLGIHHHSVGSYDQKWTEARRQFALKWPDLRGTPGAAWHTYATVVTRRSIESVWSWLNRMASAYDRSAMTPQATQPFSPEKILRN